MGNAVTDVLFGDYNPQGVLQSLFLLLRDSVLCIITIRIQADRQEKVNFLPDIWMRLCGRSFVLGMVLVIQRLIIAIWK